MKDYPLVSVLMTAYNRSKYIAEAIESVLKSTYQNLELIVVDDGSKDDTVEIAKKYEKKDPRVKVYQNEKNLGDYHNRNKAASYASGKYLKYLDSDDLIYPHGLQVMVDCMEQYPDAGLGLSENAFVKTPHPVQLTPKESYYKNFIESDLFGRAPGSCIIRTTVFRETGGFSGLRQMGDYEYWLKLAALYPIVTMPRDLVWDRIHGEQEQNYDSTTDKESMWVDVATKALNSESCPLSAVDAKKSKNLINSGLRKRFWKLVLRNFKLKTAMNYKKKLSLSWSYLLFIN